MKLFEISSLEQIQETVDSAKRILDFYKVAYNENAMYGAARKSVNHSDFGLLQTLLTGIADKHIIAALDRLFKNPDFLIRSSEDVDNLLSLAALLDKGDPADFATTIEALLVSSQDHSGGVAQMIESWFPGKTLARVEIDSIDKFMIADNGTFKQGIEVGRFGSVEVWDIRGLKLIFAVLHPAGIVILAPREDHQRLLNIIGASS